MPQDVYKRQEQVRTIDRARLKEYIGRLNANTMHEIDHAIAVSFGLDGILGQYAVPSDEAERQEEMCIRDSPYAAYADRHFGCHLCSAPLCV